MQDRLCEKPGMHRRTTDAVPCPRIPVRALFGARIVGFALALSRGEDLILFLHVRDWATRDKVKAELKRYRMDALRDLKRSRKIR